MKYFFDTEFHEHKQAKIESTGSFANTIELISVGIVAEDGREIYLISNEFAIQKAIDNEWLRNNVLKPIYEEICHASKKGEFGYWNMKDALERNGFSNYRIANQILEFIGDDSHPEFYAYYSAYDWVVFCWLFGRMIDLPKGFPMYCRDLKQMIDETVSSKRLSELHLHGHSFLTLDALKQMPSYPKQENEHNALDDARWNKNLYDFIKTL